MLSAPLNLFYMALRIYSYIQIIPKPLSFLVHLLWNICFLPKILPVTKTTSKYIAGLQDLFKDKYMNGKSNYKLKSLKMNAYYNSYNVCKLKDYQNIFILSILTIKHKTKSFTEKYCEKKPVTLTPHDPLKYSSLRTHFPH